MSETQPSEDTTLVTGAELPMEQAPAAPPEMRDPMVVLREEAAKAAEPKAEETAAEPDKPEEPKPEEKPKEGPPEKYEFKAPEGVEFDPAQVAAFEPVARDLGLTQEQAQKLVDLQTGFAKAQNEALVNTWKQQTRAWADEAKADKEYGGNKYAENSGLVAKALDKFGNTGLRKALEDSGFGNHPEVVRFFWKVGKAVSEDTLTTGASGGENRQTLAQRLFPGLN